MRDPPAPSRILCRLADQRDYEDKCVCMRFWAEVEALTVFSRAVPGFPDSPAVAA
jgi:hypothetical protein